jgi:hypothetical protein
MRKKSKVRPATDRDVALAKERLRLLRGNKKAPTITALMRNLKHVKSSGPYTRDEMNERQHSRLVTCGITQRLKAKSESRGCGMSEDMP